MEAHLQPKRLDLVRERCRVKHYSLRTEQAYVPWIRRYILFHGKRHPREMDGPEVEAFLTGVMSRHRRRTRHLPPCCFFTVRCSV